MNVNLAELSIVPKRPTVLEKTLDESKAAARVPEKTSSQNLSQSFPKLRSEKAS